GGHEAELTGNAADAADRTAVVESLSQEGQPLAGHEHDPVHELDAVFPAGIEHGTQIGAGDGAGFLAQDVLARPGRMEHPLLANPSRQREVYSIDVVPVEQLLIASAR